MSGPGSRRQPPAPDECPARVSQKRRNADPEAASGGGFGPPAHPGFRSGYIGFCCQWIMGLVLLLSEEHPKEDSMEFNARHLLDWIRTCHFPSSTVTPCCLPEPHPRCPHHHHRCHRSAGGKPGNGTPLRYRDTRYRHADHRQTVGTITEAAGGKSRRELARYRKQQLRALPPAKRRVGGPNSHHRQGSRLCSVLRLGTPRLLMPG